MRPIQYRRTKRRDDKLIAVFDSNDQSESDERDKRRRKASLRHAFRFFIGKVVVVISVGYCLCSLYNLMFLSPPKIRRNENFLSGVGGRGIPDGNVDGNINSGINVENSGDKTDDSAHFPTCNLSDFQAYYQNGFRSSSHVPPFDASCLEYLLESHPDRLDVRAAFIRLKYIQRMKFLYGDNVDSDIGGEDKNNNPREVPMPSSRYLFFLCHEGPRCGGHGDRLRGMGRAFFLALITDAKYSIFIGEGLPWDAYFDTLEGLDWKKEFLVRYGPRHENNSARGEANGWVRHYDDGIYHPNTIEEGAEFSLKHELLSSRYAPSYLSVTDSYGWNIYPPSLHDQLYQQKYISGYEIDWNSILFPYNITVVTIESNKGLGTLFPLNRFRFFSPLSFLSSSFWSFLKRKKQDPSEFSWKEYYKLDGLSHAQLYHIFLQLYASKPTTALFEAIQPYILQLQHNPQPQSPSTKSLPSSNLVPVTIDGMTTPATSNYIVGIHLRMGDAVMKRLKKYSGGNGTRTDYRSSWGGVNCMIEKTKEICEQWTNGGELQAQENIGNRKSNQQRTCSVYALSDSPEAIERVRVGLQQTDIDVISAKGDIVHTIDTSLSGLFNVTYNNASAFNNETNSKKTNNKGCKNNSPLQRNMRTFVDWYILASMSDATLISNSGFSYMASIFRSNGTHVDYRPSFVLQKENDASAHGQACHLVEWKEHTYGIVNVNGFT